MTASRDLSAVPVFVLCGGLGTRLKEETEFRPKPMVPIGQRPILWHVMRTYRHFGFRTFVLCLGYKGEVIRNYFLNYHRLSQDIRIDLATSEVTYLRDDGKLDWVVTLAETGERTMTGGRVARATQRYLGDAEHFAVTYGDGLTDADLAAEFAFHLDHGHAGTVLGVNPPSRFGELRLTGTEVSEFREKPDLRGSWINGGYFFFRREFLKYLSEDECCVLEKDPLVRLAADGQLRVFRHTGFWDCMDTLRDREHLAHLAESGEAPWLRPAHSMPPVIAP